MDPTPPINKVSLLFLKNHIREMFMCLLLLWEVLNLYMVTTVKNYDESNNGKKNS